MVLAVLEEGLVVGGGGGGGVGGGVGGVGRIGVLGDVQFNKFGGRHARITERWKTKEQFWQFSPYAQRKAGRRCKHGD